MDHAKMKSIGTIVLVSAITFIVIRYVENEYNKSKTSLPSATG